VKLVSTIALLCATATPALAQIGHPPAESPYHDVPFKQELTLYGGYFGGARGSVGAGLQGAPLVGARYAIRLGGPAEFTAHLARASSSRTVLDPSKPPATRAVGTTSTSLYLADVGLALNLTGQKSYHRLIPVAAFGLGVASDMGAKRDASGFKVGTPFALNFGAGLRYVPGGNIAVRLDVMDYLYQLSYPSSFYFVPTGSTPILGPRAGNNEWTHNPVITLGVSYLFSR
jgi:hypothetical protein